MNIWVQKEEVDNTDFSKFETIYYDCRDDFSDLVNFSNKYWERGVSVIAVFSLEKYDITYMPDVFKILELFEGYLTHTQYCKGICLDFIRCKTWTLKSKDVKRLIKVLFELEDLKKIYKSIHFTTVIPPLFGQDWKFMNERGTLHPMVYFKTCGLQFKFWAWISKLYKAEPIIRGWDITKAELTKQENYLTKLKLKYSIFRYGTWRDLK